MHRILRLQRLIIRHERCTTLLPSYAAYTSSPINIGVSQHINHNKVHHIQPSGHYTFYTSSSNTQSSTPKKKVGFIAKMQRMVRTLFGINDDTPRGIQEKKDYLWIVLAATHRRLRIENQHKLLADSGNKQNDVPMVWQQETKERLQELTDEAVSYLDDKTDISEMRLNKLRGEIQQSILQPQIIQLLNVAYDVEEEMGDEDDEEYMFSTEEKEQYKNILLSEYEKVCQLLAECKGSSDNTVAASYTSDPVPFYKIKQEAIETLLNYYDWWPKDMVPQNSNINNDDEEYEDVFGFTPNKDSEIVSAMRYYHVRNLVRSILARHQPNSDHSILPFKSTIPSSGRGVFIDGFAPAGTLLAFIPGKVWPKEHLQSASLQTQMQLAQDPRHQLSMRYDDVLIDSRHSPYTVVKNLWSLGHIVNHPPAPVIYERSQVESDKDEASDTMNRDLHQGPNCMTVLINYTDKMLSEEREHMQEYIPNEYEARPKPWTKNASEPDEIIMQGVGLVSLRDVKDEELFYDYRLSPDEKAKKKGSDGNLYPSWYHVWDQDAIDNRWGTDD